ncbi:MAG: hypothetical protein K6A70_07125, partial [Erysipelotrichaceae bacterium]|nr:hypothetical protein [Erysipelotrichaceae bacterium]
MTWDGTTECGSISLDDGEYGASAGGDYDQSSISLHIVRVKPAYGYYFRGWHVGNSDTAARNNPLSKIENPYSFSFGYNLDVANAPYYLIADFAPIGTEYDEYID